MSNMQKKTIKKLDASTSTIEATEMAKNGFFIFFSIRTWSLASIMIMETLQFTTGIQNAYWLSLCYTMTLTTERLILN